MSTKKMLIDAAHPEETRVVVISGTRLEDFDVEVASRKQLRGNIYLAKVTRVEPSLQAAFVDYGGNRHGFLAFNEIHPDYYQIPVEDREALLAEDAAASKADRAARPEGPSIERESVEPSAHDSQPDELPSGEGSGEEIPGNESASNESTGDKTADNEISVETQAAPEAGAEAEAGAPPGYAEGAPEEEGARADVHPEESQPGDIQPDEIQPESAPDSEGPKPAPVEVLGGDSDDDLEVRRPSPARRRRHYKIQEVIKRRQILLVQVVKEERGTKGAALTTYLSLAGRYCVLMPNTARGGGISRKIGGGSDRQRLKSVVDELDIPDGMAVIVRTAGAERSKTEIHRDFEYLMRTWTEVRERTLESIAPALVYEEGSIIKRAIRDLYTSDIDEVIVAGEEGYRQARELMKLLVPSHAKHVQLYSDPSVALLRRHQIEDQLASIHNPQVQLRSGGYIVINPTEALVSIDVNSGRATRERHIEETAFRTNLEAAEEIARQLRLRDLAGLIVIDFIDMESNRNQAQVERRLKEAMRHDRARIQIGRISPFGLLEMSRQRLRPSLIETSSVPCPHCGGTGIRRATDTSALAILRAIEDEGARGRAEEIVVHAATPIVLFILNQKRAALSELERRFAFRVVLAADDSLVPPAHRIDRTRARTGPPVVVAPPPATLAPEPEDIEETEAEDVIPAEEETGAEQPAHRVDTGTDEHPSGHGRRRRRGRRGRGRAGASSREGAPIGATRAYEGPEGEGGAFPLDAPQPGAPSGATESGEEQPPASYRPEAGHDGPEVGPDGQPREGHRRRRRRGRRGGRNRHRHGEADGVAPREPRPDPGRQPAARPQTPQGGGHPDQGVSFNARGDSFDHPPNGGTAHPDRGASFNARGDSPARGEFRVTTPAEAGIAFLDGPRIGGFNPEIDESEAPPPRADRPAPPPRPEPAPPPAAPIVVTPAGVHSHDETPAVAREETPEERERRLAASKTEIVDVGKVEGAPTKRGWWRRG